MKSALLLLVVFLAISSGIFFYVSNSTPPTELERNQAFTQSMSGAVLIGHSTRLNREGLSGEERYYIDGVTHLTGDSWLFRSRMKMGGREVPVPIPITLRWAGDTPVITLTDLTIPGLGTYTARVLLYRAQYAGTWSGKDGGGQLFGRIERATKP